MRGGHPQSRAAALVLLLTACGAESPVADVRTDTLAIELSIGAAQGAGPEVFGRVTGLAADSAGKIYVADAHFDAVHVFDSGGAFKYSLGGEGAGPGELDGPCCLAIDPSGRLWTKEFGNARYSVFRPGEAGADAEVTYRLAHGDVNYMAPITFTKDGGFVDLGRRPTPSGPALLSRIYRSSEGEEIDVQVVTSAELDALSQYSVEIRRGPVRGTRYFYQPFGEGHLVAHGADGIWADGVSSEYRIQLRSGSGNVTIEQTGVEGPLLSARERSLAEERLASIAETVGSTVAALPFSAPDRKPVLRNLFFDSVGNLWIELEVADGHFKEADVWSRDGVHLRTVRWPPDVDLGFPGWIGKDSALGIRRDEFDVEYVVRLADRWSF